MSDFRKIVINETYEYECREIVYYDDHFHAVFNTSDFSQVVSDLSKIELIDIYDYNGTIQRRITDFTSFSSITLETDSYLDEKNKPVSVIKVVFKKTSLDDIVESLNKKVNNIVDEASMNLEEFKEHKIAKLGEECRSIIEQGLDVETSKGVKHFTYKQDDQFNVKTLFDSARMVKMDVPFHSSKNPCTVFTWQDAVNIYIALESNLLYHTTYCNALFMNIREDLHTKEDVAKVTYGQEIPESRKTDMDTALATGKALMEAVMKNCGLDVNTTTETDINAEDA